MTRGRELKGGREMLVGGRSARQRRMKGRKKWDNFNSIINKIYLKIKLKNKKIMTFYNMD